MISRMKTLIRKCPACGTYTLSGLCPKCQEKTLSSAPPRYSPEDKYGDLRRRNRT